MPPRRPASSKDDKPPSLGLPGRPSNARGKVRVGGEAKPKDEDKIGIILDRILLGIGLLALGGLVLYLIGLVANANEKHQKRCHRLHHEAYAQAGVPVPETTYHRSIQDDINMTNCPSATEGDYGLCMRNTFNHGQHEAPVTYFPEDVMKFFWNHRPRLLQARQASFISSLLRTSYKPAFNLSGLTPVQRGGLDLWFTCTYPRFGQTLTQPLNLSCPAQAFNLLFFHNTLGHGNAVLAVLGTSQNKSDIQEEQARAFSGQAGTLMFPRLNCTSPLRFSGISKAPPVAIGVYPTFAPNISPVQFDHTPHNLAQILSQLLHEMIHAVTYLYSCPICYTGKVTGIPGIKPPCPYVEFRYFDVHGHGPIWLALAVAIDHMLNQEGVLEIPGVSWKHHRLDLHVDDVIAEFEDAHTMLRIMKKMKS